MDTILEMLSQRWEHLLGRAGGPLNFRLLIMPLVVTFFAVRAGMKDAREGQPPFFRTLIGNPLERGRLLRSVLKDVGKIFIVAVVLDTVYQLVVLKAFIPRGGAGGSGGVRHPAVSRGPQRGFLLMRRIYRSTRRPPANRHQPERPGPRLDTEYRSLITDY